LQVAERVGQAAHGAGDHAGEEHEGRELARGDPAGEHVAPADPQEHRDRAEDQRDHDRTHERARPGVAGRRGEGALGGVGEPRALAVFLRERLDGADRVDRLLGRPGNVGRPVLRLARQLAHAPADHHDRHDHERHHHEDQPGQPRVGPDQQRQTAHEQQDVAQGLRDARADHGLDDACVGAEARDHLARAGDLEEPGREVQHVAVDVAAQVGDDALAEPGDEVGAQVGRDREHGDDDRHGLDRVIERVGPALAEAAVDQVAQADAQREDGGRGEHQGDQGADDVPAIGPQVGGETPEVAQVTTGRTLLGAGAGERSGSPLHARDLVCRG
jgi:hypothetical protein